MDTVEVIGMFEQPSLCLPTATTIMGVAITATYNVTNNGNPKSAQGNVDTPNTSTDGNGVTSVSARLAKYWRRARVASSTKASLMCNDM